MKLRVGIDVGGTFTDVTAFDEDRGELVAVRKYVSNPVQPAAVMETITADLARDFGADAVTLMLHGSTAALNTLLEGKGVRTGLLTTRGFRDVYEIGRQWRGEDVFNIFAPAPKMLLPRDRIFEIGERIGSQGEVVEPLRAKDVASAVRKLVADGVEAVAVCFLFAYANPAHEQAAAEIIRAIAPGLYVSLSHEVNPEWREYERTASTVANAYIGPPVSRYLRTLEELSRQRFPRSRALMMKSDGGAASARMLARTPIQTVMSGPVAGVIGGRHLGDVKGIDNLITFDTGGTSSDMAVLPGRPLFKSEVTVARHPLRTHTVDIETIGAGGGSIIYQDKAGILHVGPESAGAEPGPIAYARGGTRPTVTDANVLLGRLDIQNVLPGTDSPRPIIHAAFEKLGAALGTTAEGAAQAALRVIDLNMAGAIRKITLERGLDTRKFVLIPFGGAGPLHACSIAENLRVPRVLVPIWPGVTSALGCLLADIRYDDTWTVHMRLDQIDPDRIRALYDRMVERVMGVMHEDLVSD
ncbi:MAG: N-methylhydantoinase, partial [Alphaproteobacteria bacterium]|nr:N-methylhydantoinase [Alphaproteobacteria bacterium]